MAIPEHDISILIPTYRYRELVVRAVRSALESGAGEIIVCDDKSEDGTKDSIAEFDDPRLIYQENNQNLGLWENHLCALSLATKPWIKFIQADDWLLPDGLKHYAEAVEDDVSVVWGAPTIVDQNSGIEQRIYEFIAPIKLEPSEFQAACYFHGHLLGSPSHMMLRADTIERDPRAWKTDISSDMVVGNLCAASGSVVLIPPGTIAQGCHPDQDSHTQSGLSGVTRMVNSLQYLRERPEPGLSQLADTWAYLAVYPCMRTTARTLLKREQHVVRTVAMLFKLITGISKRSWVNFARMHAHTTQIRAYRRSVRRPKNLDLFFSDVLVRSSPQKAVEEV